MSTLHVVTSEGDKAVTPNEDAALTAASQFLARVWCADTQGALTNVHMIAEKTPAGWIHHPVYAVEEAVALASAVSARAGCLLRLRRVLEVQCVQPRQPNEGERCRCELPMA